MVGGGFEGVMEVGVGCVSLVLPSKTTLTLSLENNHFTTRKFLHIHKIGRLCEIVVFGKSGNNFVLEKL